MNSSVSFATLSETLFVHSNPGEGPVARAVNAGLLSAGGLPLLIAVVLCNLCERALQVEEGFQDGGVERLQA